MACKFSFVLPILEKCCVWGEGSKPAKDAQTTSEVGGNPCPSLVSTNKEDTFGKFSGKEGSGSFGLCFCSVIAPISQIINLFGWSNVMGPGGWIPKVKVNAVTGFG